ncbi:hypothetical protein ACGH6R_08745 [Gilliamella sp. CG13]|uniref:hypothetical protein n=1 Tax=Gilliamella sp. CG13 TaxID=3351502 RepID=UPI0039872BAB
MKKFYLLLGYILFFVSLSGHASSNVTEIATVKEQFKTALLCQSKPFAIEDKKIIAELEKQKITIKKQTTR